MTAAFLHSALAGLVTESKKKSNDVRTAAEKSLADLKSISVTSETQLAGDLSRRADFIEPFVLACQTKQAKLALSGTACLQRLIASRAVPRDQLHHVLSAYRDSVDLSYEVQLKILQTLPALLQLYGDDLHDELLARVLDICATLQASKTTLVANSAGATLDQLVESIFAQAETASRASRRNGAKSLEDREDSGDQIASVKDACRMYEDFCLLLNRGQPGFLATDSLSSIYLLRVLEKIIERHGTFVRNTETLVDACRVQILPAIERLLNGKDEFLIVAHCTRLTYVLLEKLSAHLAQDAAPILDLCLTFADRDAGPLWKRSLSLELFRSLLTNFGLLMRIFDIAQGKTDNVVAKLMAALVRIAAEDPTLIGMGRQSTMPAQRGADAREDELASIEAQGIGGGGLASVSSADASVTGIGLEFSTLERPLIDAEESSGPSNIPKTYVYTLVLESISSLCEGLSKFVMPLSVTTRQSGPQTERDDDTEDDGAEQATQLKSRRRDTAAQKYQRLANPLKRLHLPQLAQIQTCASIVDQCWPAILATSSTFLNAALDSHFYHILIRSMQKLAQVSGTLELSTPRDALLTSLAKGSVPANAASIIALSQLAGHTEDDVLDDTATDGVKSPRIDGRRQSVDMKKQSLNVRHLLCLRALLNLGIALGPTLGQEAWFIFIETLQQVEALMSISVLGATEGLTSPKAEGARDARTALASEMTAATTASNRMFDSTRSYGDDAFTAVITALFRLIGETSPTGTEIQTRESLTSHANLNSQMTPTRGGHRAARSVSGIWVKTKALNVEVAFVLAKARDLARINIRRFVSSDAAAWDLIGSRLLQVSQNQDLSPRLRLEAAEILDLICMESVKLLDEASPTETNLIHSRSLGMLYSQVRSIASQDSSRPHHLQVEIGQRVFEALEDILGHSGESLDDWSTVFAILKAADHHGNTAAAFRCVQLICNDFLQVLSSTILDILVSLMASFAGQQDTNMALTTASLLRNIATLAQERSDTLEITSPVEEQGPSRLWLSTIQQLAKLCDDPRRDVRDASVRILMQALDASGELLTAQSWKIILEKIFNSLTRQYIRKMQEEDYGHWEITCVYLTETMTTLIKNNISSIARDPAFSETWNELLGVFEAEIEHPTFQMYAVVFNSIGVLLEAMSTVRVDHKPLLSPALLLWARYPPYTLNEHLEASRSNQEAFAAHASLMVVASTTSPAAVDVFRHEDKDIAALLQSSIHQSILLARHPSYSNDIRKLAIEQQMNLNCIMILRGIMKDLLAEFSNFLLSLLESMHREDNDPPAASNKWQKPTFVAISVSVLGLLREIITDGPSTMIHFDGRRAFKLLAAIIATKYDLMPYNPEAPLWKEATTTATVLIAAIGLRLQSKDSVLVAESIVNLTSSVLGCSEVLDSRLTPSTQIPPSEEDFDVAQFTRIHATSIPLISLLSVPEDTRKRYVLTIFHASILAEPWFDDFPEHILHNPLKDINNLRRGSVHSPVLPKRKKIVYAALDALFDLANPTASTYNSTVAKTAFPYLLLRIAHPIKTFLADQPLRGLTPFPLPQQTELYTILRKCLSLRCDDGAFAAALAESRKESPAAPPPQGQSNAHAALESGYEVGGSVRYNDGKSHLRAMHKMILRFQKGWKGMMRLKEGMAWQDGEEGKGIEECMEKWVDVVAEGWGM